MKKVKKLLSAVIAAVMIAMTATAAFITTSVSASPLLYELDCGIGTPVGEHFSLKAIDPQTNDLVNVEEEKFNHYSAGGVDYYSHKIVGTEYYVHSTPEGEGGIFDIQLGSSHEYNGAVVFEAPYTGKYSFSYNINRMYGAGIVSKYTVYVYGNTTAVTENEVSDPGNYVVSGVTEMNAGDKLVFSVECVSGNRAGFRTKINSMTVTVDDITYEAGNELVPSIGKNKLADGIFSFYGYNTSTGEKAALCETARDTAYGWRHDVLIDDSTRAGVIVETEKPQTGREYGFNPTADFGGMIVFKAPVNGTYDFEIDLCKLYASAKTVLVLLKNGVSEVASVESDGASSETSLDLTKNGVSLNAGEELWILVKRAPEVEASGSYNVEVTSIKATIATVGEAGAAEGSVYTIDPYTFGSDNPHGQFEFMVRATADGALTPLVSSTVSARWYPGSAKGYGINGTDPLEYFVRFTANDHWQEAPTSRYDTAYDVLWMGASADYEPAIRFTAPADGTYELSASFKRFMRLYEGDYTGCGLRLEFGEITESVTSTTQGEEKTLTKELEMEEGDTFIIVFDTLGHNGSDESALTDLTVTLTELADEGGGSNPNPNPDGGGDEDDEEDKDDQIVYPAPILDPTAKSFELAVNNTSIISGHFKLWGLNAKTGDKLELTTPAVDTQYGWRYNLNAGGQDYGVFCQGERGHMADISSGKDYAGLITFTAAATDTYKVDANFVKLYAKAGDNPTKATILVIKNGKEIIDYYECDGETSNEKVGFSFHTTLNAGDELWFTVLIPEDCKAGGGFNVGVDSIKINRVKIPNSFKLEIGRDSVTNGAFKLWALDTASNKKLELNSPAVDTTYGWRYKLNVGVQELSIFGQGERGQTADALPSDGYASLITFSAPIDGRYAFDADFVKLYALSGGEDKKPTKAEILVYKNGTQLLASFKCDGETSNQEIELKGKVNLKGGDEIWFVIRRASDAEAAGGYNVGVASITVTRGNPSTGDNVSTVILALIASATVIGFAVRKRKHR